LAYHRTTAILRGISGEVVGLALGAYSKKSADIVSGQIHDYFLALADARENETF
jgi:hypothetical protein